MKCTVVATCRIQESRYITIEKESVRIMEYNDEELPIAIDKHIAYFYESYSNIEYDEIKRNIHEAVARGLPIREVCKNPLTLRMLFFLYSTLKKKIPTEIHISKLYQEYWDARVKEDRRAGSIIAIDTNTNLEISASAVALSMLAEGSPELHLSIITRAIIHFGGITDEIDKLVSRGILIHLDDGTIRIFIKRFLSTVRPVV